MLCWRMLDNWPNSSGFPPAGIARYAICAYVCDAPVLAICVSTIPERMTHELYYPRALPLACWGVEVVSCVQHLSINHAYKLA